MNVLPNKKMKKFCFIDDVYEIITMKVVAFFLGHPVYVCVCVCMCVYVCEWVCVSVCISVRVSVMLGRVGVLGIKASRTKMEKENSRAQSSSVINYICVLSTNFLRTSGIVLEINTRPSSCLGIATFNTQTNLWPDRKSAHLNLETFDSSVDSKGFKHFKCSSVKYVL